MAETNTPAGHACTTVRTLVITPEGGGPFLVVEVEIDCAVCGQHFYRLAGHHVASLAASFQAIAEEHGRLAGRMGERVGTAHWEGTSVPGKPGMN